MGTISTYLEIQNLPNKPSKSTTGHDAVADVLLHWHHLIIIVGADPILLALAVRLGRNPSNIWARTIRGTRLSCSALQEGA